MRSILLSCACVSPPEVACIARRPESPWFFILVLSLICGTVAAGFLWIAWNDAKRRNELDPRRHDELLNDPARGEEYW
jgi:hypothetical protein